MNNVIGASALLGCIVYLIVAIEYVLILRKGGVILLPAFLFSAFWSMVSWRIYALDFLHVAVWSASFILVFQREESIAPFSGRWYRFWSIPVASLTGAIYLLLNSGPVTEFQFYFYLVCCIGALLLAEQLIRNTGGLFKAIGISLGALFLYNLYLYSSALIVGEVPVDFVQARGLANTTVALLLCFAPLAIPPEATPVRKLGLSRPVVFTTTSLVLAGGTLLFVSILGYLLRANGGEYALVVQPFFVFLAVLFIGINLASSTRRAKIKVWISKNFFQTKFDYNEQWRNLSTRLSLTTTQDEYPEVALKAVLPIYQGTGGVCYIVQEDSFTPVYTLLLQDEPAVITRNEHSGFLDKMLVDNWIFFPSSTDPGLSAFNTLIPETLREIDDILLILPLINDHRLLGILVVTANTQQNRQFDFEDIDLLRMVGMQVSNFVAYQILSSEMVVTRQFEAFHQFTTFIMHDLKNLIAQQALVVENASRFIDNPEFVADAINTIDNSVKRMKRLLLKMSQDTGLDLDKPSDEEIEFGVIIQEAIDKCAARKPVPDLDLPPEPLMVRGDAENLVMAFTHLISNSQEACEDDGRITVTLEQRGSQAVCIITDNGVGMEESFIAERLFKPFDSTKKNQGMGVGAYQYKQILSKMGGRVAVTSTPGEGSCFTITLPLSTAVEKTAN